MEKRNFPKMTRIIGRYKPEATPVGKATAELEASRNPMKYLKSKKYLDFKKVKGVAV